MKRTIKMLTAWVLILMLWASPIQADITRPVIRNSLLSWSSYHAYHCIKQWDGDLLTVYQSRLRTTLKAAESNRRWAKRQARRMHLRQLPRRKAVRRIFEYVVENYDYYEKAEWLEDAIRTQWANCSAYADLFYVLCKAAKIPVRYVIGWADNGRQAYWHCWNRVRVGKRWYYIDCTWAYWLSRKLWKSHSNIIEEW